jgi:hypothetical protein
LLGEVAHGRGTGSCASVAQLLRGLVERGFSGVELVVSDAHA